MTELNPFTLQDDVMAVIQSAVAEGGGGSGGGISARLQLYYNAGGSHLVVAGGGVTQVTVPFGNTILEGFTAAEDPYTWVNDTPGLYMCVVDLNIASALDSGSVPKPIAWETPWGDFGGQAVLNIGSYAQGVNQVQIIDVPAGEVMGLVLSWFGNQNLAVSAGSLTIVRLEDSLE